MELWKQLFKFALWVVAILALVGGVLKYLYVDAYVVGHEAMAPTMLRGETVLAWRTENIEFGDVAVCESPSIPGQLVMGRIVGIRPDQVVQMTGCALTISNSRPDVNWGRTTSFADSDHGASIDVVLGEEKLGDWTHDMMCQLRYGAELQPQTVRAGKAYLLGDFRSYVGQDSRSFGQVDVSTCRARVFMRWKPVDDRGAGFGHGYLDLID